MWKSIGVLGYLCVLGIYDFKTQKVPVIWLKIGSLAAGGYILYQCCNHPLELFFPELLKCLGPGILMLAAGKISGKIGMGDGCVLLVAGSLLGGKEILAVFAGAILLVGLWAAVLLIFQKAGKDSKIPFVPFLAVSSLLSVVLLWLES